MEHALQRLLHWRAGLLLALLAAPACAQQASEADLKAALIYNFAVFVDWPAGSEHRSDPLFHICVYGREVLGASLGTLEQRTVRGRRIATHRISESGQTRTCDLLFVAAAERRHLSNLLAATQGSAVLTISDAEAAARTGAMIGLAIEKEKMVFDINTGAARRNGLTISSKLLRLSRTVYEQ
jgi:hypothetical protein